MRFAITLAVAAVLGLAIGLGAVWLTRSDPPTDSVRSDVPAAQPGDPRPPFSLADLDGRFREAAEFDGAPLLINFWATWCRPCVREMPLLQRAADRNRGRLAVVGIAIDDREAVAEFVRRLEIDYPILVGADDARDVQRRYGNPGGMLPYSVLVDADGVIRWRHLGELNAAMLERALARVMPDAVSLSTNYRQER